MNLDESRMDPTLVQLLNELIRAHGKIQQLQARIIELENKNGHLDKAAEKALAR